MKIAVAMTVLLPMLGFCLDESAHFQVVDQWGKPVAGAMLTMEWTANMNTPKARTAVRVLVSGEDGVFQPDGSCPYWAEFRSVEKDGYEDDPYLNPHPTGPYYPDRFPKEKPFKFVLQKINEEKEIVLCHGSPDYGIRVVRRGEKPEPIPLWVVRRPESKEPIDVDCFARTAYDEARKAWMCTFWTTNANSGVQVSTNRVMVAPATGYVQRVEVPLAVCYHPMFTLYAKTYNPQLYAMFSLHGFCPEECEVRCPHKDPYEIFKGKERPDADKQYGALEVEYCYVNPFGGRVLEMDCDLYVAMEFKMNQVFLPFLAQHRYPPRPSPLVEKPLLRKIGDLRDEIRRKINWFEDKLRCIAELQEACQGKPNEEQEKALKQLEKESEELRKYIRERQKELEKLNDKFDGFGKWKNKRRRPGDGNDKK